MWPPVFPLDCIFSMVNKKTQIGNPFIPLQAGLGWDLFGFSINGSQTFARLRYFMQRNFRTSLIPSKAISTRKAKIFFNVFNNYHYHVIYWTHTIAQNPCLPTSGSQRWLQVRTFWRSFLKYRCSGHTPRDPDLIVLNPGHWHQCFSEAPQVTVQPGSTIDLT